MGIVWSKATRAVKNVNAYHRAHKVVSQEKPKLAPRHPKTKKLLDEFAAENPQILNEQHVKNVGLLEKLKDVKVESYGQPAEIRSARKLPETRTALQDNEYGVREPDKIPEGKTTLRLVHKMLIAYQESPNEQTVSKLSKEYKLDEKTLQQVLDHFKAMSVHIPEKYLKKDPKMLEAFQQKNILPLDKSESVAEQLKLSHNLKSETSETPPVNPDSK